MVKGWVVEGLKSLRVERLSRGVWSLRSLVVEVFTS